MSSSVTTKSHPSLSPAERRAERARTEGSSWKILFSEVGLTRKSDGKRGRIRFALVTTQPGADPYTVRLANDGSPCRCSCSDWTRRADAAAERGENPATVEACKHSIRVALCQGQDQQPQVPPCEEPMPAALQQWAEEKLRVERATRDAAILWDDIPTF